MGFCFDKHNIKIKSQLLNTNSDSEENKFSGLGGL